VQRPVAADADGQTGLYFFVETLCRYRYTTVEVVEVVEVAGFDGQRCTVNSLARRDPVNGEWTTMNRLTSRHADTLMRAGFDPVRLGGGLR
jgi:hypothetical protein